VSSLQNCESSQKPILDRGQCRLIPRDDPYFLAHQSIVFDCYAKQAELIGLVIRGEGVLAEDDDGLFAPAHLCVFRRVALECFLKLALASCHGSIIVGVLPEENGLFTLPITALNAFASRRWVRYAGHVIVSQAFYLTMTVLSASILTVWVVGDPEAGTTFTVYSPGLSSRPWAELSNSSAWPMYLSLTNTAANLSELCVRSLPNGGLAGGSSFRVS
jgi:hypothetical protein